MEICLFTNRSSSIGPHANPKKGLFGTSILFTDSNTVFILYYPISRENKKDAAFCATPTTQPLRVIPHSSTVGRKPAAFAASPMCIASRVSAMLRRISSCSCSCGGGSSSVVDEEEDFDLDFPTMSPKLTLALSRQETSRGAACSGSASDMSLDPPFPPMSAERLKPQPFRRKDPPMHFQASVRGDRQELNKWLISGGDPNSRDEEGWALLHHASVSVELYAALSCCWQHVACLYAAWPATKT